MPSGVALRSMGLHVGTNASEQEKFEQGYSECFIKAFAEDLESLREAGGNSKLILYSLEATRQAFRPSEWQT